MFLEIFDKKLLMKLFKNAGLLISLFVIKISIKSNFKHISILGYIFYLATSSNNFFIYIFNIISNKNKPFIILLEKGGFNEDIQIIKNNFKEIDCIGFSRTFVKGIASCYLSKDICDNNYFSSATIHNKSKVNLFVFYDFLFSRLPLRVKPIAIFTGNFGYSPEQELFKASSKNNIKGIAIQKECLKPDGLYDLWKYIYSVRRGVFGGTLVLNYNQIEEEIQKKSQVINTKKTRMKIIGCPRLDDAHYLRKNHNLIQNHQVLMFGFGTKSFLPVIPRKSYGDLEPHHEYLNREDKNLTWAKLIKELCTSFYKCAQQNPHIPFIIKLKEMYRENYEMLSFFEKKKKLSNIKITTKGNALTLVRNSSVVISHRSTTLFEGIARGIPVIIPNLGECRIEKYKKYIFEFTNTDNDLITVNTEDEFIKELNNILSIPPNIKTKLSNTKKEILDKWMGNADGKSGQRLISILKKELK